MLRYATRMEIKVASGERATRTWWILTDGPRDSPSSIIIAS